MCIICIQRTPRNGTATDVNGVLQPLVHYMYASLVHLKFYKNRTIRLFLDYRIERNELKDESHENANQIDQINRSNALKKTIDDILCEVATAAAAADSL